MAKKKELKKDPFFEAIDSFLNFMKRKKRLFLSLSIVFFLLLAFFLLLFYYEEKKEEELQILFSQALKAYEGERFEEAEKYLKKIIGEKKVIGKIAKLYYGRVAYKKGEKKKAKEIFEELKKEKEEYIRMLAEDALRSILQ